MSALTISIRDLRRLVDPVLPCAGGDLSLPVLTSVRIESRGKYLTAVATDRFRMAMQRVAIKEGEWPEWAANVPTTTLRSILATFKPSRRDADPMVTLTIATDGTALSVAGDNALLDFKEALVSYPLEMGQFPKVRKVIREALAAESTASHVGFNPALIAACLPKTFAGGAASLKITDGRQPIVITDGEDFVSILMPRRLISGSDGWNHPFPSLDDWAELLADEPTTKKRKGRAA